MFTRPTAKALPAKLVGKHPIKRILTRGLHDPRVARLFKNREIVQTNFGMCWQWTGYVNRNGYGQIRANGPSGTLVHRIAYGIFVGEIPKGLSILHRAQKSNV